MLLGLKEMTVLNSLFDTLNGTRRKNLVEAAAGVGAKGEVGVRVRNVGRMIVIIPIRAVVIVVAVLIALPVVVRVEQQEQLREEETT